MLFGQKNIARYISAQQQNYILRNDVNMYIRLIRNEAKGKAITGRLMVDCEKVSEFQSVKLEMDTLEHLDYAIPAGFYRVRLTYSPRFKEILPILDGVIGYRRSNVECRKLNVECRKLNVECRKSNVECQKSNVECRKSDVECQRSNVECQQRSSLRTGIRIHAGNTIAHTTGCILVGESDETKHRLLSSRKALDQLRDYLMNYQKQNPHEEIYIDITEPDAYPLYDVPYEHELQER